MARLELPHDVYETILQKLDIAPQKSHVLIIYHRESPAWSVVKVRAGSISEADKVWLEITDEQDGWWIEHFHHRGNSHHHVTNLVHRALAIGFKFPDEAARSRADCMEDFEMERPVIYK
jgi:hypothetical protein